MEWTSRNWLIGVLDVNCLWSNFLRYKLAGESFRLRFNSGRYELTGGTDHGEFSLTRPCVHCVDTERSFLADRYVCSQQLYILYCTAALARSLCDGRMCVCSVMRV